MKIDGREYRSEPRTAKALKADSITHSQAVGLSVKGLVRIPKPEVVSALIKAGGDAGVSFAAAHAGETFLTRREMAKALQISLRTLARMLAQGAIPCIRIGKRIIRFRLADVVQHFQAQAEKEGT